MQSVSQYDTRRPLGSRSRSPFNHDFWTFTPANPSSSYLNRYHVRFGPAENPAVSVEGTTASLAFTMRTWLPNCGWTRRRAGWRSSMATASYAMVERFRYEKKKPYPGKASVIFWMNGPERG